MIKQLGYLAIACLFCSTLAADDWDANDDTFDPTIKSVVIGERSWIGDPSPFGHVGLKRTGYTHVHVTNWEGFPPSVQISLMVPNVPGETQPPAGGMLMFNKEQASKVIKTLKKMVVENQKKDSATDPSKSKPIAIETSIQNAKWTIKLANDEGKKFFQFESKTNNKTDQYRFSLNATKKLVGAMEHSLTSLKKNVAPKLDSKDDQ